MLRDPDDRRLPRTFLDPSCPLGPSTPSPLLVRSLPTLDPGVRRETTEGLEGQLDESTPGTWVSLSIGRHRRKLISTPGSPGDDFHLKPLV